MRTHSILIATALTLMFTVSAAANGDAPIGREVARDGAVSDLSGTLEHREDEWFVRTEDGSYQLMLGRFGHTKDLPFVEGGELELSGFTVPEYVAPMQITADGTEQKFWHEERYPLWAGSGERRNAVAEARGERADEARGLALDREPLGEREDAPRVQQQEHRRSPQQRESRTPPRGGRR